MGKRDFKYTINNGTEIQKIMLKAGAAQKLPGSESSGYLRVISFARWHESLSTESSKAWKQKVGY